MGRFKNYLIQNQQAQLLQLSVNEAQKAADKAQNTAIEVEIV